MARIPVGITGASPRPLLRLEPLVAWLVYDNSQKPRPAPARRGDMGPPCKLLPRDAKHHPVSAKELAVAETWKKVTGGADCCSGAKAAEMGQ